MAIRPIALTNNWITSKDIIMKIFAICIGLTFGIFAIAVYAYSIKQRIKDSKDKSDEIN